MIQLPGKLFVVVGPSGVGKDSLMEYARQRLKDDQRVQFVRRTITRPADSGGEDHDHVPANQFAIMQERGDFAVSWEAHGLHYGIPAAIKGWIASGNVAIANGSRQALPLFAQAFPELAIVSITANAGIVADRLFRRGRESEDDIRKRLNRADSDFSSFDNVVSIDNSGALTIGGERLVELLTAAARHQEEGPKERESSDSAFARFVNNAGLFL